MTSSAPPPAISAPTGETTDFNAQNPLAFWNALTQGLALSLTGILWFLRIYVRAWIKRIWTWEDYFTVLSFWNFVVYCIMTTTVVLKGGGAHEWNVEKPELASILFYINMAQIWYGITAALIKTTILMLYIRIFSPTPWSKFNIAIKALMVLINLFYLSITFAKIFQCWPRDKIFTSSIPGTCINLAILLDVSGIFNCLSDIVILLVPIRGLWFLQISTRQKLGIYVVFTVGIVGPVFSLIGFIQRYQRATSPDLTFNQEVILLWATAELAAGMMITCLPTIPGIFQHHKRQQSRSLGASQPMSNRSRSSKFGVLSSSNERDSGRIVGNNYFELVDRKIDAASEEGPTRLVLNKMAGGKHEATVQVGYNGFSEPATPDGRILKTVTVEQSRF